MTTAALRTYRATYHPKDRDGFPNDNPTGVLPSIRVSAADAESAIQIAHAETGCPIANVERLDDDETPELVANLRTADAAPARGLKPALTGLAMMGLLLVAGNVGAQTVACTKIGFKPGEPDPNHCVTVTEGGLQGGATSPAATAATSATPASTPAASPAASASPITNSSAPASTASASIGGDTVRSTVAVFPAPSTAAVPIASGCIVTTSTAGGIGWNLLQGARSEQHSDPVCVLQWLVQTSTDPRERDVLRAVIFKRITGEAQ